MSTPRKRAAVAPKKRGSPKNPKPVPGSCSAPECGRDSYSRGLCQTHRRQLMTTGVLKRIRPYRKRSAGTVKFAGLRLTPFCAEKVTAYAKERDLSEGAAIAEILEDWRANFRGA